MSRKIKWKWTNFPIPEAYLAALIVGVILNLFVPLSFLTWPRLSGFLGSLVFLLGTLLAIWSVLAWAEADISKPNKLIENGSYAFSRHPMYVAWFLIDLGVGLLFKSLWLILLLGLAAIYTHFFVVLTEERYMEGKFGQLYRSYKSRVRRYI